jgi:integrase
LTAESRRLVPKTAQRLASALRSLLRFWHLQGLTSGPLDRAVPKVANRRPGLPRPLEPAQVQAMLASCDRGTAAGRHDLAILTLLARMVLRAGEVAGLRLDDGWRLGEITVRGKGNRRDRLPCRPMRARLSRTGCGTAGPPRPWIGACSSGSRHRTGA